MLGDIEMKNASPSVIDREPHIEDAEGGRGYGEEVHGRDSAAVVAQVSQRSSAPEGGRRRGRHLDTLRSETSKPSMRSSPWMRGAPQVGLSNASRCINARRRASSGGLPGRA